MEKYKSHYVGNRRSVVLKKDGEPVQYVILNSAWKDKFWMLTEEIVSGNCYSEILTIENIISIYKPNEETISEIKGLTWKTNIMKNTPE